jgi:transcriptional regulator with XRE-family HTH domain
MIDDEKRGKLICELRKKKNLTQKELGDLIHYTDKNISKWERGISFPNNPNVINKLAEVFEISVEELMYGELRIETNEIEIRENFAGQYKDNYNKYRKNIFIILFSFLVFIIISLISIYMVFIRNSISVYSLVTDDSAFDELNSTIVITNKLNILSFTKINNEDINLIYLYYIDKQGNKKEIFKGENANYYIEEKRNYEEYFLEKLIKNKIYLEISYSNNEKTDVIEMNAERKYINDSIFPKNVDSSIEINKELVNKKLTDKISLLGFTNKNGFYEKKINKNAIMTIDPDTMNLFVEINKDNVLERISNNYSTNSILYEKLENGEIVQNMELKISDKQDCQIKECNSINDYAMYINYINNELK